MENLNTEYRISIYSEVLELSKGKIYIVKSSLDDKIYVKKILNSNNKSIYEKIKNLSINNIPKIYEIISSEDKLIIIEEYINGSSLKEILDQSKTIPEEDVVDYTLDLIDIIEKLHSSDPSIIHKDIKPSNIMINNDGILKLIDFDISRVHKNDQSKDTYILGTYGYASPEQFGFYQTDRRTDIYSIGITMNMMLEGELPKDKINQGNLSKIIVKCTQLDPNKRYQDVNALRRSLSIYKGRSKKYKLKSVLYKLPGLKSKNLTLKVLSIMWYLYILFIFSCTFDFKETIESRISFLFTSIYFLSLTLFYGNFMNIHSDLYLLNSKKRIVKFSGYVLYTIIISISLVLLLNIFSV